MDAFRSTYLSPRSDDFAEPAPPSGLDSGDILRSEVVVGRRDVGDSLGGPVIWMPVRGTLYPNSHAALKCRFSFEVLLSGRNARHRKHDYGGAQSTVDLKRWR